MRTRVGDGASIGSTRFITDTKQVQVQYRLAVATTQTARVRFNHINEDRAIDTLATKSTLRRGACDIACLVIPVKKPSPNFSARQVAGRRSGRRTLATEEYTKTWLQRRRSHSVQEARLLGTINVQPEYTGLTLSTDLAVAKRATIVATVDQPLRIKMARRPRLSEYET